MPAGLHGAVLQVFLFGDKLDVFRLDYGGGYCHDSRDAGYEPLAALPSLAQQFSFNSVVSSTDDFDVLSGLERYLFRAVIGEVILIVRNDFDKVVHLMVGHLDYRAATFVCGCCKTN